MPEMERKKEIEEALLRYLPGQEEAGLAGPVQEAMQYALMAGGKRIRPQLLMLTFEAFSERAGETPDREIPLIFASALEMIHTYSLIHDDLPAMDDDSLRRGRPTVHVAFGEDIAILAGDGLLNMAYEVACGAFDLAPGSIRVEKAMRILARKPGLFGMLGGQTADVTLAGKKIDDKELDYIYENKTAALLECAMQIGAVLGGASDREIEEIGRAASDAGFAFQVQDDILDMTGDAEQLGKEVGQDERNEKITYVVLHGMEAAEQYVREKTESAVEIISELLGTNAAAEELKSLLRQLVGRKN